MNAIDKAADRLRGRWHQGNYRDTHGNVCVLGALNAVRASRSVNQIVIDTLHSDGWFTGVVKFNDDPATTEEDVLLLLKKASARYDETHGASS